MEVWNIRGRASDGNQVKITCVCVVETSTDVDRTSIVRSDGPLRTPVILYVSTNNVVLLPQTAIIAVEARKKRPFN